MAVLARWLKKPRCFRQTAAREISIMVVVIGLRSLSLLRLALVVSRHSEVSSERSRELLTEEQIHTGLSSTQCSGSQSSIPLKKTDSTVLSFQDCY